MAPPFRNFSLRHCLNCLKGVWLIAIEEVRNYRKFYTLKTFLKMADGRVNTSHPSPTPLDPPFSPDHKPQKPSKEFGIFQSPGTISFVLFYSKAESRKGGGMAQCLLSQYTFLLRSLRLGAWEQIISSFKEGLHVYKRRSGYSVLC